MTSRTWTRTACLAAALALALSAGTALAQSASPTATPATPGTGGVATMSNPARSAAGMSGHAAQPGAMASHAGSGAMSAPSASTGSSVDINTASAAQLDAVPQIGPKRAAAIIAHRPYKSTDELVSKKALSAGIYNKVKARLTAG